MHSCIILQKGGWKLFKYKVGIALLSLTMSSAGYSNTSGNKTESKTVAVTGEYNYAIIENAKNEESKGNTLGIRLLYDQYRLENNWLHDTTLEARLGLSPGSKPQYVAPIGTQVPGSTSIELKDDRYAELNISGAIGPRINEIGNTCVGVFGVLRGNGEVQYSELYSKKASYAGASAEILPGITCSLFDIVGKLEGGVEFGYSMLNEKEDALNLKKPEGFFIGENIRLDVHYQKFLRLKAKAQFDPNNTKVTAALRFTPLQDSGAFAEVQGYYFVSTRDLKSVSNANQVNSSVYGVKVNSGWAF